jgi:type II secretion system protein H
MSARTRTRRGFTLVELLVALVIVGLIGAVAVATLRARGGGSAAVAKELATVYESAREIAIRRGRPAEVQIDLADGSYCVLLEARAARWADTARAGVLGLGPDARLAARAARSGRAHMRFDALGRAHGDVIVIADGRSRHEVVADPWTGATRIAAR